MGTSKTTTEAIIVVTSLLSLIGELFIIAMFIFNKRVRKFPLLYVLYIQVADLLYTVGSLFVINDFYLSSQTWCTIQAIMLSFGQLSSVLWATVIAFTLYHVVIKHDDHVERYNNKFFAYALGLPIVMILITAIRGDIGPAGSWCWIRDDEETPYKTFLFRFMEFYLPVWLACLYCIYAYFKVSSYVKRQYKDPESQRLTDKLKWYPIILVLCYTMATFHRIYLIWNPENHTVKSFHAFFSCLIGFFNAIVYGFSRTVREIIVEWVCCKKSKIKLSEEDVQSTDKRSKAEKNTELQIQGNKEDIDGVLGIKKSSLQVQESRVLFKKQDSGNSNIINK